MANKFGYLKNTATIARGTTPKVYGDFHYKVIRSGDLTSPFLNETKLLSTTKEHFFKVLKNDILISSIGKGSIGKVRMYLDDAENISTVSEVTVLRNTSINPYFLCVYLQSKYGQNYIEKNITGSSGQLHLNTGNITDILVPNSLTKIGNAIELLLINAFLKDKLSKDNYSLSKEILLEQLGFENFESKKTDNYQEINLSESFISTTRLDAEYYHPKPLFLIDQLEKKEYYLVKELFDIGNGYPWRSKNFKEQGEGEPFVRIRNCKPGYIDNETLTTLDSDYAKGEKVEKAKPNDIVIGMDGIKYFYGSLIKEPVYVNQRVCHLTPKDDSKIDSELVLMIINSIIGQTQLMREMTIAQTVGHITNASVGNLIIPKLDEKIRNEVSAKIKESHRLEKESLHLLEVAKKAVEIAIEENEENALKYIKRETNE